MGTIKRVRTWHQAPRSFGVAVATLGCAAARRARCVAPCGLWGGPRRSRDSRYVLAGGHGCAVLRVGLMAERATHVVERLVAPRVPPEALTASEQL
jgi:hypothetical protein